MAVALISGCAPGNRDRPGQLDTTVALPTPVTEAKWTARRLDAAPARFRPQAWSSETWLWGILRGRVARIDVTSGEVRTLAHEARLPRTSAR